MRAVRAEADVEGGQSFGDLQFGEWLGEGTSTYPRSSSSHGQEASGLTARTRTTVPSARTDDERGQSRGMCR